MATDTLSQVIGYGIIIGVFIFFGAVMYKALKSPIDLLFSKIMLGFSWIGSQLGGLGGGTTTQTIKYE